MPPDDTDVAPKPLPAADWADRVFGCAFTRTVRDDDDRAAVYLKRFMFKTSVMCLLLGGVLAALYPPNFRGSDVFFDAAVVFLVAFFFGTLVMLHVIRRVPEAFKDAVPMLICILAAMTELNATTHRSSRFWVLYILIFDFAVIFKAWRPDATFWFGVASITFVGVYQTGYVGSWMQRPTIEVYVCDCPDPPCVTPLGSAVTEVMAQLFVYALACGVTKAFASRMERKQVELEKTIQVAEDIAGCLSAFDLTAAEALLHDEQGNVPDRLHAALRSVLRNLQLYRPYLPDELFADDAGSPDPEEGGVPRPPLPLPPDIPGSATAQAAVLFSDIRQSTSLWEKSEGASMHEALNLHNGIVRAAIMNTAGYEVKTIGDAFMIAHHCAPSAVRCAVAMQAQLSATEWPQGLVRAGLDDGFPALTVRIGVHFGPVAVEPNTLTGRYDYFGPTVNKAARVEGCGVPGAVTITEEVMACMDEVDDAGGALYYPFGAPRQGKGLLDEMWLTAVLPDGASPTLVSLVEAYISSGDETARRKAAHRARHRERQQRAASCVSLASSDVRSYKSSDNLSVITTTRDDVPSVPSSSGLKALRDRTVRAAATVGVVKFACHHRGMDWLEAEDALSSLLQVLYAHTRATGGHLSGVMQNVALISWSVYGRCTQHLNESLRCMLQLRAEPPAAGGGIEFWGGLVTGPVATGQLAASASQRFMTLLGPSVDVAQALCHAAAELDTAVLVASLSVTDVDRYEANVWLKAHLRQVDTWRVGNEGVPVHELCLLSLQASTAEVRGRLSAVAELSDGWSEEYDRAYAARDIAALRLLVPGDPVVAAVCRLLETGATLQHALARWGSEQEDAEYPVPL